jgi:hypothetical protein
MGARLVLWWSALAVALAASVSLAPSASAGELEFLHQLSGRWAALSDDQLLTTGYRVCVMTQTTSSSNAVPVVQKELDVSVPAASAIVAAAVVHLDC